MCLRVSRELLNVIDHCDIFSQLARPKPNHPPADKTRLALTMRASEGDDFTAETKLEDTLGRLERISAITGLSPCHVTHTS